MGRITIFTSDDTNSAVVCKAFQSRNIPYYEISITKHPHRSRDLLTLTGRLAVPAVFFNTRAVMGGVDKVLQELHTWDFSERYKSPLDKYYAEIVQMQDPSNPRLALEKYDGETPSKESALLPKALDIGLMDGTKTTYADITERLRGSLPLQDIKHKGSFYKNVFSGEHAAQVFKKTMDLSPAQAIEFGNRMIEYKVICPVVTSPGIEGFSNSNSVFYRLQCYMSPNVLNSYREWNKESTANPTELVKRLNMLMMKIRADSIDAMGMLDCSKCLTHYLYTQFEEEICELQAINFSSLDEKEKLAFSINIFRIMIAYAIIKVGIPMVETDRFHFMTKIRFVIENCKFSLQEWVDGVIRGNRKSIRNKVPFDKNDARQKFALKTTLDYRIHFALSVGSVVGSRVSPPFTLFSASNIDSELNTAARVFFDDEQNLVVKKGEVSLSKALAWYRRDFANNASDEQFINVLRQFMNGSLTSSISTVASKNLQVTFHDVNWGQTSCNFTRYERESPTAGIEGVKAFFRRFRSPKTPENEELRIQTLRNLNILDTLPDERLDRITRAVQIEFGVPICLVSLVDTNRQWFKSNQWSCPLVPDKPSETGRDISFCGHVILQNDIMVVNDALLDDRFADNPLVTGDLKIRFYAGVPLAIPNGRGGTSNVGTLCIIDQRPRELAPEDITKLKAYAQQATDEMLRQNESLVTMPYASCKNPVLL